MKLARLLTILLSLSVFVSLSAFQCGKEEPKLLSGKIYKARLEIAGMCGNYTFSNVDGQVDPKLVEASWTDPQTSKVYKNAFTIADPCGFPSGIKEGETFSFRMVTDPLKGCAMCAAYYPTPGKKLNIKVIR
ncbi:hypothetical protein [Niabella sp.]|uniref:hypothetical protein n=1 Tax=Niabella sp. TaxID=1962976 RepID=UPI002621096B|nr:hypothetical protein [Niabella sp.]